MTQQKHKRVKHWEDPGHVRELTFSCLGQLPILTNDAWREMLSRALDAAVSRHLWKLTAFVFMPEHVHLLLYPEPQASGIHHLLKAIKRPYSYRIKQILNAAKSPLLARLTVQQRPGIHTFRYWQEGPGYDRNLFTSKAVLSAMDYFHLNPVRRGLVERATDWIWSSARFYAHGESDPRLPTLTPLPATFFDG